LGSIIWILLGFTWVLFGICLVFLGLHLGFLSVFIGIRGGLVGGREGMGFPPRGRETGGGVDGVGTHQSQDRYRMCSMADKGNSAVKPYNSTVKQAIRSYRTEGGYGQP
jgi:hypothetical protein